MNNLFYGILLPMLITITPFEFNYYHDNKSNVKKAILWGIISFIVCLFVTIIDFNNLRLDISRIRLTTTIIISISTIISTLFNIGLVKEIVNAKKAMKLLLVLSLFFFIQLTQYIPIKLFNLDSHNLSNIGFIILVAITTLFRGIISLLSNTIVNVFSLSTLP